MIPTITLEQFKSAIIKAARNQPDKVGPRVFGGCSNHCLIGQALHDLGCCVHEQTRSGMWYVGIGWTNHLRAMTQEVASAVKLNDTGTPWGQIPAAAGLLPAADTLCSHTPSIPPVQHVTSCAHSTPYVPETTEELVQV